VSVDCRCLALARGPAEPALVFTGRTQIAAWHAERVRNDDG
jgi:hypothetical protein